jgi:putative DNA primase/helicase
MGDFDIADTAASIARSLNGERSGNEWRCTCPVHGGHSLCITESQTTGKLLFKCWGGDCSFTEIMDALRGRELISGPSIERTLIDSDEIKKTARRIQRAQSLYRGSFDAPGTLVESYLRSRGIKLLPPVLRFIRWCPHRNGHAYAAVAAPIVDVDNALIGMSATFLRPDGSGKVDLPSKEQRQFYGVVKGGAVRLETLGEPLFIGEGIESLVSAMQLYANPAGWAALSAFGLAALELPPEIQNIVIVADNDDAGIDAALAAHRRWSDEGRTVRIITPPDGDNDFNDTLQKRARA